MKIRAYDSQLEIKKILLLLVLIIFSILSWFLIKKKVYNHNYSIFVEFENAHGIRPGTPLRLRGFTIGSVIDVTSEINSILVLININSSAYLIPKNSLIETNQTGLLNDSIIDIVPLEILSEQESLKLNPLDSQCIHSKILCHLSYIEGERGLNYDDLIRATTRISQRFDDPRFFNLFYIFLQNGIELSDNILNIAVDFSSFISLLYNRLSSMN